MYFKKRIFSWLDSYDIFDENGDVLYTVKGQLSFSHSFVIFERYDRKIAEVNQKISQQRADAVADLLKVNGIAAERITTKGMSFDMPVADNAPAEGKAKNRRVEIYLFASEAMIQAAQNGTLK